MNTTRILAFAVIVLSCWLAYGCTTPPPADPPLKMQVIKHSCDRWGVNALAIQSTGTGQTTIHWDNEKVCGVPS